MHPPGAAARFRVEDNSLGYGSSWSVRTSKSAGDVYITHREGGRWIHTSLHDSGESHYTVTRAGRAKLAPGESPYLAVGHDKPKFGPGWTHAKRITVAKSELRSNWSEGVAQKEIIAVPTHPIVHMALGNGGQLEVIARPTTLDVDLRDVLAEQITCARRGLQDAGWDGVTPTRMAIFGQDADTGLLIEIEIAVDPDQDKHT